MVSCINGDDFDDIDIEDTTFEHVEKFRYLGTTKEITKLERKLRLG